MQIAGVFSSQLALPGTSPPARTERLLASEPPGRYGIGSDTWPGLATLAADAAQVVQVVSAIIGSGEDAGPEAARLRECLQDQLGDLRAAIDYVIGKNALDWNAVNRRRDRRRSRYERDHHPAAPAQPAAAAASPGPGSHDAVGNGSMTSHSEDPADSAGPGPHHPDAAETGPAGPRGREASQSWPVPRQQPRPPRPAPDRSARRAARTPVGASSLPSSTD